MRFGSCFAGIGGFDLGLESAGFEPAWQIELSEYCRAVLARHWPDVARFSDIRSVPLNVLTGVDLICGGFPCQDISVAGRQAGLDGEQSRLWYDMLAVIERARPSWVVVENSPALRTRGADTILGQLESFGYACWPLVVGAWAVGAGHRRDRVWIVAHANGVGRRAGQRRGTTVTLANEFDSVEHSTKSRLEGQRQRLPRRWPASPVEPQWAWEPARTIKRSVGSGANGFSTRLAERRRKRELEALGAAVVPQVAEAIGRAIMNVEQVEAGERSSLGSDLEGLLG